MVNTEPIHLLLLPPIASVVSFQHLKDIYGPPLTAVFSDLLSNALKNTIVVIDVALACPYLCDTQFTTRSKLFNRTQADLATLYRLICILLSDFDDPDEAERIDARIILLQYANDTVYEGKEASKEERSLDSPVIDLPSLAQSGRQWQSVLSLDNKDGERMAEIFLNLNHNVAINRVASDNLQLSKEPSAQTTISGTDQRHTSVAVGGTFDHLHIGHKLLLTMTAFILDCHESDNSNEEQIMTIGITGDKLLKNKKFAALLEPWQIRQRKIADFLQSILCIQTSAEPHRPIWEDLSDDQSGYIVHVKLSPSLTLRCVELKDPYGPPIHDESISALVISAETKSGGEAINSKRIQKGWLPLDVYQVNIIEPLQQTHDGDMVTKEANDKFQGKLSSTEIRRRIFTREAHTS